MKMPHSETRSNKVGKISFASMQGNVATMNEVPN